MSAIFSSITQTPYYALSLKTAIFDGALRLYFAPEQESQAFKIYAQLKSLIQNPLRNNSPTDDSSPATIYIMMYPDQLTMNECFAEAEHTDRLAESVQKISIGTDLILGLNGHHADIALDELSQATQNFLNPNSMAPQAADMRPACPA